MTTISFKEEININKFNFKTLEEFQLYIVQQLQQSDLDSNHKKILDNRLKEAQQNPNNFITLDQLKSSITRK